MSLSEVPRVSDEPPVLHPLPVDKSEAEEMREMRIYGRSGRDSTFSMVWPPALAFVLFIAAWEWLPALLDVPNYMLPPPSEIVKAAQDNFEEFSDAIIVTSIRSVIGFVLSGVLGVLAALLMASSHTIRRVLYPYAVILHTIPIVSIAPLIIIWIGSGTKAILTISFTIGFFTVLANTLSGLLSASANSVDLLHVYRARKWQEMFLLRLPSAQPYILTALKISCTLSVIGAIIGEYMAGNGVGSGGLGYTLVAAVTRFQTAYVFAVAIASALLGVIFYLIVNFVSNRILGPWHESAMRNTR